MRLIDADALKGKESYIMLRTSDTCFGSAKIFLTETIDNAPTVDAVPVVRCGDCVLMKKGEIMTIDEAIKRYVDNAEYERTHGNLQGCLEFKQLAKWLKELRAFRKIYLVDYVNDYLRVESEE